MKLQASSRDSEARRDFASYIAHTKGCPPVLEDNPRALASGLEDNPRALASGLSYVQADNP